MKPNEAIIIGGGASLKEGIEKDLWNRLKGKFTIGLNLSYRAFESTIQCLSDPDPYKDWLDDLKKLSLNVVRSNDKTLLYPLPNTIILPFDSEIYHRDISKGCYSNRLTGLFALSLSIYLLECGKLYILGYDFGRLNNRKDEDGRIITHWHQNKFEHSGVGKFDWYESKSDIDNYKVGIEREDNNIEYLTGIQNRVKVFEVYKYEKRVKIYNVSLLSKINTFEKIGYDNFFNMLNDSPTYNQSELREFIKSKLKPFQIIPPKR